MWALFTLFTKKKWTGSKRELQDQNGKTRNAAANRCWHTFVVLQIIWGLPHSVQEHL